MRNVIDDNSLSFIETEPKWWSKATYAGTKYISQNQT